MDILFIKRKWLQLICVHEWNQIQMVTVFTEGKRSCILFVRINGTSFCQNKRDILFVKIKRTSCLSVERVIFCIRESVDSTRGFEMFSSLCSDFKVTFLIHLGWMVNSAMSVYLKFNVFQNGTSYLYEESHFIPNFATHKRMSMSPPYLKYNQDINAKCFILQ